MLELLTIAGNNKEVKKEFKADKIEIIGEGSKPGLCIIEVEEKEHIIKMNTGDLLKAIEENFKASQPPAPKQKKKKPLDYWEKRKIRLHGKAIAKKKSIIKKTPKNKFWIERAARLKKKSA